MIKVNEIGFVSARELYEVLGYTNKGRFQNWFESFLDYGFKERNDFNLYNPVQVQEEGGRTVKRTISDYLMTLEMAKEYALLSRTENGKEIRKYLISLDNKKQDGLLLSHEEILALQEMVIAAHFKEFRDLAREKHLNTYLPNKPKNKDFANAHTKRNMICGIDKYTLEKRLNEMNIKYSSVEKSLLKVDKFELIRISVIDVMLHFGKSNEYALNIGNLAKELSKTRKDIIFDRVANTMFNIPIEFQRAIALLN